MRVAINGFGRIGRNFLRAVFNDPAAQKKIDVVVINIGPARRDSVAHMFKYDTLMGTFKGSVAVEDSNLVIDGHRIALIAECNPGKIDWKKHQIDWVVESSGCFTNRDMAEKHLAAGAHAVLISAPAHDEDVTIIMGVNEQEFNKEKDTIVSIGSCTTNAIVPMLDVLDKAFGVEYGAMTTIHAYTNTQVLLDVEDTDMRRSRAAALNIIPTTTGSATLIGTILPQLKDKITAVAVRVPVAKVSLIDLVFQSRVPISSTAINDACTKAQSGYLQGIMDVTAEPLVSSDFSGNSYSVIIDSMLTKANGTMCQLFGWYDNEWGYSERLKDFLMKCAS